MVTTIVIIIVITIIKGAILLFLIVIEMRCSIIIMPEPNSENPPSKAQTMDR